MPRLITKRTDSEWDDIIRRCKASGMSDWRWCRENSISQSSFYRHLEKLHDKRLIPAGTLNGSPDTSLSMTEAHDVVPVTIENSAGISSGNDSSDINPSAPAAQLHIGNASVILYNTASAELVNSIISAVSMLC